MTSKEALNLLKAPYKLIDAKTYREMIAAIEKDTVAWIYNSQLLYKRKCTEKEEQLVFKQILREGS